MMRTILALALLASPAAAQECGPAADVAAELTDRFGERLVFLSPCRNGTCAMFSNDGTGTWTWVFQPNPFVICVLADGKVGQGEG